MFDNIGKKIKTLAKIICYIGVGLSVITGIGIMVSGMDFGFLIGIGYAVVGSLAAWVGSFFTYGFGQLIENTDAIRYYTKMR